MASPRGGDGSVDVFRSHTRPTGGRCPESRCEVDVRDYVSDFAGTPRGVTI